MKFLNKQSAAVFNRLLALKQDKIDNDKSFMAVCFEEIGMFDKYPVYSIAHYYLQNGDMMADPEMTFIYVNSETIVPASFQQDNLGIYQESVYKRNGQTLINLDLQHDHCHFANQWLMNIKRQQRI